MKAEPPTGVESAQQLELWLQSYLPAVQGQYQAQLKGSRLNPGEQNNLSFELLMEEAAEPREDAGGGEHVQPPKVWRLDEDPETVRAPLVMIGEGGSGKTTALLLSAARAAKRRLTEPGSPIPIYVDVSRVTKASDFADVAAMLAGSIPFVGDAGELSRHLAQRGQCFLILIDSFNEISTDGRRTLARSLTRFVQAQGRDHLVVIGSRKVAELDVVAKAPVGVRRCEVLRLQPERVREHMKRYDLAEKFDALPPEVQGLAGNRFMFFAIVRTLSRGKDLPTNRGTLYAQFTDGWMEGEANRRRLDYDYARVKVPVLAHLAKRMTAAGQTVMTTSPELEEDIEKELATIYKKIERIGGMPDQWRVREFMNEVLYDGLLKDLGGQLQFLHQSVQEFYTALWFSDHQDALVEFTPRLDWEAAQAYGTLRVPEHRFVVPLLILAGLGEASSLIRTLEDRHPVLAAAALASASYVDPALPSSLERSWRALLDEPNPKLRVGLGCLIASCRITDSLLERLLDIVLEEEFDRDYTALEGLGAVPATLVLPATLRRVQGLGDEEAARQSLDRFANVVERFPPRAVVRALSPAWHAAGEQAKERILRLRPRELNIDRETLDDIERAFVDARLPDRIPLGKSILETIREARRRAAEKFKQARERKLEELRSSDPAAVRASLTADHAGERSAAATVAVERQLPVFDDSGGDLLSRDCDSGRLDFIEALVSLGGADRTIAALSDRAKWARRRIAVLPLSFKTELHSRRLSEAAKAALIALGVEVEGASVEDDGSWVLEPSSWSGHRPTYEARETGEGIELYDLNVPARALEALLRLPDSGALRATVQAALEDEALQATVLELIGSSENSWMAQLLLDRLKVATSYRFVHAALSALGRLQAKEGVALVDDLLLLGTDKSPGTHPSWKPLEAYPDYRRDVHAALVSLEADEAVFARLDPGLRDADADVRRAAIAEYLRWLPDPERPDERLRQMMTVERLNQLDQMASDPDEGISEDAARVLFVVGPDVAECRGVRDLGHVDAAVRLQAARGLRHARRGSIDVIAGLDRALDDDIADVALPAAESLVALGAEDVYPRVRARVSALATSTMPLELRRRASAVLARLPGATQPFYAPIQRALNERRFEQAARLIEEALPIIPDDVELHWWAGHTHVALGQLEAARTSFERAAELEPSISIIPLALADTLLKLGHANAALVAGRKAVSLGPESTDARIVLAWALYKTGAYDEAAASAQQALDLDPISPEAAWILVLAGFRRREWPSVDKPARHLRLLRTMLAPDLSTAPTDACAAEIAVLRDLQPEVAQTLSDLGG